MPKHSYREPHGAADASKRMLGDTHDDICSLLRLILELEARRCTRSRSYRPSRMLQETFDGSHPALIRRSIFGLTRVYN